MREHQTLVSVVKTHLISRRVQSSLSLSTVNEMNPDIEPVVVANSKFSIDLLKELCKATTDNVVFSPLSISSALGLVLLGAGEKTADQMFQTLHFSNIKIMYHYLYEELYREGEYKIQMPGRKEKRSLQLVNRMFGDKTVHFKDDFLDYCEDWCFGSLRCVDFKTDPEAARTQINNWVKKICDGLQDVLDKGDVSKDTSLALISAVYFNKKWVNSFKPTVNKEVNGKVWKMMVKDDKLRLGTIPHRQHGTNYKAQILEMPYENNDLSMFVILPNNRDGLAELVKSITYEQIMEWTEPDNMIFPDKQTDKQTDKLIHIEMPVFKLEEKYDLQQALTVLGITDLFSGNCDLSGMAPEKLKLSKMVHKCVVEVNETGTIAEAGSGGGVVKTLQSKGSQDSFIVDRPFLFFIRHNPTKSILFWGRVISPTPARV